jgi:hypothetical protein
LQSARFQSCAQATIPVFHFIKHRGEIEIVNYLLLVLALGNISNSYSFLYCTTWLCARFNIVRTCSNLMLYSDFWTFFEKFYSELCWLYFNSQEIICPITL